jgi:luciferase family oxidoreductase group 1
MIKLGVLEFGLREPTTGPSEILEDVMNYAIKADKLGYSRWWVTEHHNLSPAWNNPEMLLPIVAGLTNNLKIGMAGILLSIHSPYRVALSFKLLSNLFPGRIDLGLANGVPNYRIAQHLSNDEALRKDFQAGFDEKLSTLTKMLRDERAFMDDKIMVTPYKGEIPDIWNLRSTCKSLSVSLDLQLNFSLSTFHSNIDVLQQKDQLAAYREAYENRYGAAPQLSITVAGVCHKNSQQAARRFAELGYGVEGYPYNCFVGSPAYFVDKLSDIRETLKVDEFIFHNLEVVSKERMNNLVQLSKAFGLKTAN